VTRAQAEAFLTWLEQAKAAATMRPESDIIEDPKDREQRERVMAKVLAIFEPAGEVIDTLFNGKPDEGLKVHADKQTGVVQEVFRAKNPRVAIS
jgi:hypothetical protein